MHRQLSSLAKPLLAACLLVSPGRGSAAAEEPKLRPLAPGAAFPAARFANLNAEAGGPSQIDLADYLGKKRRKNSLLEEARVTGAEYGAELMEAGMSLSQAMHAFTFFRRNLDKSAKQALAKSGTAHGDSVEMCEQIMALADEVLLGIAGAYESSNSRARSG